jgi:hypothetical protein
VAIGIIQGASGFYDPNRDMHFATPALSPQEQYDRERYFRRMQEEEHRRMQNYMYQPGQGSPSKYALAQAPTPAPVKDPLAFLRNADNKLLLTGATS